ncbi:MAG: hypothetical protein P8Z30_17330 [Acidobacteriota bacterium]
MNETPHVQHRWQFCSRCNGLMFDYYASSDGHFGIADLSGSREVEGPSSRSEIQCRTCGARYRLLDRLDAMGRAVNRI